MAQTDVDAVLLNANLPKEIVSSLDQSNKKSLANYYLSNPSNPITSTSFLEVDNLGEINRMANMSFDELLKSGFTEKDILTYKELIAQINTMSYEEIASNYNVDHYTATLIKSAASTEHTYFDQTNDVKASGSISSSKLTMTCVYVADFSTNSPDYIVRLLFIWDTPPMVCAFDDAVAVAWGGNLVCEPISSSITYESVSTFITSYTGNQGTYSNLATYKDIDINQGGAFYFPTTSSHFHLTSSYTNRIKSGIIDFRLYQTGSIEGYTTKVIAHYCHKTLIFGDISVSYPPSISVGFGYDKSEDQASGLIKY